ncbi:MAG TPA: hypothetical protein VHL99_12685 [Candidatus Binatia bacterium]|jgi:hypothetical protein|nr:hypothetical protein [Candidatus Binatia bacterium]
MKISVPLTETYFYTLRQNASPGSPAGKALEASAQNFVMAGVRKIFTVRCTVDIAEDLKSLAALSCPTAAPIIASIIEARVPELIWVKRAATR